MMRLWIEGKDVPLDFDYDCLAESIIKSPTCVYKIEIYGITGWVDITYLYMEQINTRRAYWIEREMEGMKIKTMPRYSPGEVVDLTYKNGGLPNRIIVTCSFWRQGDKQWMYKVFMESTGISEGWRFCGNFEAETALANGKLIAENEMIKNVRLYPALDRNNQFLKGKNGIWIIYKHTISNDGEYLGNDNPSHGDIVDIK